MWSRYSSDNGSTWSVSRIFNQATILGSVSQSAGVPTGAVMQYGSSADGRYLRLANGLQICWHNLATTGAISTALLGGYRNAGQTWAFPAAFSAAPIVVGNPSTLTASGMVFNGAGTTAVSAFFTAPASQASAALAGAVVATGMWFNP
jgi:hypothetical protein